ncbi:MAG: 4-(cytidine 5'-diphospho)-2-C-methyl-D-erythritol kinase, partial [Clostridia bacterium]|nr:4-(cytidine 5'-diphospho)-2-C-methyl-D-erythritol kinase [Clostridia bacterium]
TMKTVRIHSYAKLNLSLNITGVKEGYHLLDSFVCSLDLSDFIVLKERKDALINVFMRGMGSENIPLERNVALLAGEAFVKKYNTHGADITVYKNIPMGAGMGGSSADAAGVLNGMAKLYGITDLEGLKSLADSLGSDTGYMLHGGFARMRGRGEQVEKLQTSQRLNFLLICPQTPVSTAECYHEYDRSPDEPRTDTERCIASFLQGDYTGMGAAFYNALTRPACALNKDVERALEEIAAFSPLGYGMSGSGSTVFALFETRELCEWASSRYRGKFRALTVQTVIPEEREKPKLKWRNPFVLSKEEQDECK